MSTRRKKKCISSESEEDQDDANKEELDENDDSDTPKVVAEIESSLNKKTSKATIGMRLRVRSSMKRSAVYCEDTASDYDSDFENDEEAAYSRKKRKATRIRPKGSKKKSTKIVRTKSIASYFGGKSKSPPSKEEKERELKKRRLDPETRAFLDSGVPDVVIRAKKVVEKKKEEDDYLTTVGFFPKISQVNNNDIDQLSDRTDQIAQMKDKSIFKFILKASANDEQDLDDTKIDDSCTFRNFISESTNNFHTLCCSDFKTPFNPRPIITSTANNANNNQIEDIPWIEKYKVDSLKDLVCDKKGLNKLTQWLKQWKSDIKDDGGASRKIIKKKRKDSDSDFVTSDEETDEIKKKSVILGGPSGSGKTTAVYITAKHYGFHVVEVNFSSRRSGKEVIQRVEEAVLSHRLESSSNCLLLFKDIDLLDTEEDEGFYAAVAQLITTAVRPIVMTTSKDLYSPLDSKIDKKDPLRIYFDYPKSCHILRKVLLPIILDQPFMKEEEIKNKATIQSILQSICLHGRCDIRQVINQTQVIFACQNPVSNEMVHQHSIQQDGLVDLGFIRGNKNYQNDESNENENIMDEDDDVCLTIKARKKKQLEEMEKMSQIMSSLADLDFINGIHPRVQKYSFKEDEDVLASEIKQLKSSYFDSNFCSMLYSSESEKAADQIDFKKIVKSLIFDTEKEVLKADKIYKFGDEVGEYFDQPCGEGVWESASCLRTIVKRNVMDSVGRLAKRNGRLTCYFNRLDKGFVERVCQSFGYDKELEMAKNLLSNCSF